MRQTKYPKSISDVLSIICDDVCWKLFSSICSHGRGVATVELMQAMELTRKKYYLRVHRLREANLISRTNACYRPTTLGKIVYGIISTISICLEKYWMIDAIDRWEGSKETKNAPAFERERFIHDLVDNAQIRNILLQGHQP